MQAWTRLPELTTAAAHVQTSKRQPVALDSLV
jgi:hypothetical protein